MSTPLQLTDSERLDYLFQRMLRSKAWRGIMELLDLRGVVEHCRLIGRPDDLPMALREKLDALRAEES